MYKNLFAFLLLFGCANTALSPPDFAAEAVCDPVFKADGKEFGAGKAFLVNWPSAPNGKLVLTAIHLFGPSGGLEADVPASQLPSRVKLSSCRLPSDNWKDGKALYISGAKPGGDGGYLTDFAAFTFSKAEESSRVLALADENPKTGEAVWLVSKVVGGDPSAVLHPARVIYSGDEAIVYEFSDKTLNFRATSGAPVVNASGQVVGINFGGGEDDGKMVGFATSATTIRKLLKG